MALSGHINAGSHFRFWGTADVGRIHPDVLVWPIAEEEQRGILIQRLVRRRLIFAGNLDATRNRAARLREAEATLRPVAPFAHELGIVNLAAAYAVQRINVQHWRSSGRRQVGRKIGLTSKTVQEQLGVDQPDYGTLFSDMEIQDDGNIKRDKLIAPRVEAEIGLILERDTRSASCLVEVDHFSANDEWLDELAAKPRFAVRRGTIGFRR